MKVSGALHTRCNECSVIVREAEAGEPCPRGVHSAA